jgi:hypothetical protein
MTDLDFGIGSAGIVFSAPARRWNDTAEQEPSAGVDYGQLSAITGEMRLSLCSIIWNGNIVMAP